MTELAAAAARPRRMWLGPFVHEAEKAFLRALEAGANELGAAIEGDCASFRDCWAPRRTLARRHRCSVRTVQRKITAAKRAGRLHVHRSKRGEVPPGAQRPFWCGFSHKFTSGWGKAGDEVKREIERARLKQLERDVGRSTFTIGRRRLSATFVPPQPALKPEPVIVAPRATSPRPERVTSEWLDAQLAETDHRRKARDGPQ